MRRLLLAHSGVAEFGGPASAVYRLHALVQQKGVECFLLNLLDPSDTAWCRYALGPAVGNPEGRDRVETCAVGDFLGPSALARPPEPEVSRLVGEVVPDLVVAVGHAAAVHLKRAAPDRRVLLLTSTCESVRRHGRRERRRWRERVAAATGGLDARHALERAAVSAADLVLAHSEVTRTALTAAHPVVRGKLWPEVVWFAEWIREECRSHALVPRTLDEREVDLLFVARDWSDPRANAALAQQLVARFTDRRIVVLGEGGRWAGARVEPELASRRDYLALLARTRTLVVPAFAVSAPYVVYEGAAMGCNVVTSAGCGSWRACAPELVAPLERRSFEQRIRLSLARPFPSNLDALGGATHALLETAAALAA